MFAIVQNYPISREAPSGADVTNKHCKICDGLGHTPFNCPKKARKPLVSTKRLKANGKHHRLWQAAKRAWYKANPAEYYTCSLQIAPDCRGVMVQADTTLDHIKSRGRHPELRYDPNNLQPACHPCNNHKGSRDLEEIT